MDNVLKVLERNEHLTFDELKEVLSVSSEELSNEIAVLEKSNKIVKIRRDYHLVDQVNLFYGKLSLNKSNNGFLRTQDGDVFIPEYCLFGANNEDEVVVKVIKQATKFDLAEGEVVKICKRGLKFLVCRMTTEKSKVFTTFTAVDSKRYDKKIKVATSKLKGAVPGNICLLELSFKNFEAEGKVVKVLGHENDPGADIMALVSDAGTNVIFNDEIMKEIEAISDTVEPYQLKGRIDYTKEDIITIDGDDAKDLDDAVIVKKLDNGNYELSVFIADVSSYVKEGTELNKEAYYRGTSIYLVDRVIPMLPHKLSNGICSLNPNVVRLVLGCVMTINKYGDVIKHDIVKGYIKSKYRMTYNDVNKILVHEDKEKMAQYQDILPMLKDMLVLSNILREKRYKRGALEFEVPEMKIICDKTGKAVDVVRRTRDKAEMLIEDFMLAANETVAQHFADLEYPCIYRVHDKPDSRKMDMISSFLQNNGVNNFSKNHLSNPKTIQQVLENIKDDESLYTFNSVLLRGMAKAKYSESNLGHFGLAATFYCHFTSPIRRYPDLMVHRVIHRLLLSVENFDKDYKHFGNINSEIANNNSIQERKAIELERTVNDMKSAEYMSQFIGQEYEGRVSSITSFGMFIMLDNTIEGLIHINSLSDYYKHFPDIPALVAQRSKKSYKIGDKVNIRVVDANKDTRKIDFEIVNKFNNGDRKYENRKPKQKSKF
ncbi:MAG: ribonuclease R [bacterium]